MTNASNTRAAKKITNDQKKLPKDEQNDQNDNNTKLSKGANKITINETDKNEHNDH